MRGLLDWVFCMIPNVAVIAEIQRRELPGSTHRHLHSSLLQYLTKHLTISMARPLLDSVATGLTLQLTRLITKVRNQNALVLLVFWPWRSLTSPVQNCPR